MRTFVFVVLVSCFIAQHAVAQQSEFTKPFRLRLVSDDGKPVSNRDVRFDLHPSGVEVIRGKQQRVTDRSVYVQSDEKGVIQLRVRPECYSLEFRFHGDGYSPYIGTWDNEKTGVEIPDEFEAVIDRAWSVGGIIVDEAGVPVQGVEVRPSVYYKQRPGVDRKFGTGERCGSTEKGLWQFDHVPISKGSVFVEFRHREFKPHRIRLSRDQYQVGSGQAPSQKIVLSRGLSIVGRVTGEKGEPIANALVRTKFLNDVRDATTDKDGRYEIGGCEDRTVRIVATAKNHAIEVQTHHVKSGMNPVDFKMSPGGRVRVRVVDARGKGLHRARIFFQEWRGSIDYFEFRHVNQYTDKDGVWEWNEAPTDEFFADICHPQGMQLSEQRLLQRDEEYVFAPPPYLIVSGIVIDDETKKLVSECRVVPGVQHKEDGPINWLLDDAKQVADGRYSIRHFDEKCFAHFIRVEADGFMPQVSRNIESDEGDVTLHFKLRRGEDIRAIVKNADGNAVADANVIVAIANTQLSIRNGYVDNGSTYNAIQKRTGVDGIATFSPLLSSFHLIVLADEGYAHVEAKPMQSLKEIQLTPWATVAGTYHVGKLPADRKSVQLTTAPIVALGAESPNVSWRYDVVTNRNGEFRFARVTEGNASVRRKMVRMVGDGATEVASTQVVQFTAKSMHESAVSLGGTGVTVKGTVVAPERMNEMNWRHVYIDVAHPPPAIPVPDDLTIDEAKQWKANWILTGAGRTWLQENLDGRILREKRSRYVATCSDEGVFSITDVVPGKYELTVRYRDGDDSASRSVTIDVASDHLDLGSVELK